MGQRDALKKTRRWVIKIGSAVLTASDGDGLNARAIARWVEQIAAMRGRGYEFVLVSSGAVAAGMRRLGWRHRPHALYQLQAAAAVGQMSLVQAYESAFQRHGLHTAQVLLTHDDISDRERYLHARSTLRALLELGVVPIVNENDTIVTEEIRFGDNDTLAALVTGLVDAELLVILTDQAGLHERDPRQDPRAPLITEGRAGDPALKRAAGKGSALGRGGMMTKLRAAETAAQSGASTVIASGGEADVLRRIGAGEPVGTWLRAAETRLTARQRWLAGQRRVQGKLLLDAGAARALRESGRSLLPVGVAGVEGRFRRGDMVVCEDPEGREVARGLVNYDAQEAARIAGHPSDEIEALLGYVDEPELIHRDNMLVRAGD